MSSSVATKRRIVAREAATSDFEPPQPDEFVCRILAGRGNNLHEVELTDGSSTLASMPTKFRRTVWVKRGDFVLCRSIDEGNKVTAEISRILSQTAVGELMDSMKSEWPQRWICADECTGDGSEQYVDRDMLPPSDSSDSEIENENSKNDSVNRSRHQSDASQSSDENSQSAVCNPNRTRGLFSATR